MNPFTTNELRELKQALTQSTGSSACELPGVFADSGPSGAMARELFSKLRGETQEDIARYCAKKLQDGRWAARQKNREVARAIFDEISISVPGAAHDLGTRLTLVLHDPRIQDPWMRIQASLALAEFEARDCAYQRESLTLYKNAFAQFRAYLEQKGYERGERTSLFEPIAIAQGDPNVAKEIALESVLIFGEDYLRLLWGVQARDEQVGDSAAKLLHRSEEISVANMLRTWMRDLNDASQSRGPSKVAEKSWYRELATALVCSERGEGPSRIRAPETPLSRQFMGFITDAEAALTGGKPADAEDLLATIQEAIVRHHDLHFTALMNQLLQIGYMRVCALYRLHNKAEPQAALMVQMERVRKIWKDIEKFFNEPGSLWPREVEVARTIASRTVPRKWRDS